ncbi:nuclease-related domain-containing protein [Virgibacillus alimentarius]|uniref:NERD domain-containing protein n=1 Tax=Virgibacillus alimentarius TaxID=698769 RepID=A0ABS4S7B0_9BACI|nr:hypothetical protein [Virgibacillus alimentarius]
MIVKQRKKPHIILAYEALFRRLKERYRQNEVINESYQKFNAGYRGEKNVDYQISLYPHENFFIFHDLRLGIHSHYFQLDTLILTRNFICILEIKNLKGKLNYDTEQQQLTQETDGKIIRYKDPIQQVELQKRNLEFWLHRNRYFNLPIETLVIMSNPSTIITNIHKDPTFFNKWIHAESIHFFLDNLESKYTNVVLNKDQLKKLNHLLLKGNTPLTPNLFEKYNISNRHLIDGIPCPQCNYYPMVRQYKKWSCPKCANQDSKAHERAILDYFLLYKDTITNKECRNLLQLASPRSAYNILKSMELKQTGKNKARKYHAPIDFPMDSVFPLKYKSILDY